MLSELKSPNCNRTKVIATIGPASAGEEVLTAMISEGVDICRLNFSHGGHAELEEIIHTIRGINAKHNLHTCILCDLQGPKLRLGEMENGAAEWERGDEVIFTTEKTIGTRERVYITYPMFPADVRVDDKILVDDGKLELRVVETNHNNEVKAIV